MRRTSIEILSGTGEIVRVKTVLEIDRSSENEGRSLERDKVSLERVADAKSVGRRVKIAKKRALRGAFKELQEKL